MKKILEKIVQVDVTSGRKVYYKYNSRGINSFASGQNFYCNKQKIETVFK